MGGDCVESTAATGFAPWLMLSEAIPAGVRSASLESSRLPPEPIPIALPLPRAGLFLWEPARVRGALPSTGAGQPTEYAPAGQKLGQRRGCALIAAVRLAGHDQRLVVRGLRLGRLEEGVDPRQNQNRDEDEKGGQDDLEG